jgi:hypothetical protein
MLFQWASTTKIQLSVLVEYKTDFIIIGSNATCSSHDINPHLALNTNHSHWNSFESNVKHHTPPPKLYSLWFIPTGARTHDLPHSRRARKPLHLDAVKLRYNPNHKLCMVIHCTVTCCSNCEQYICL